MMFKTISELAVTISGRTGFVEFCFTLFTQASLMVTIDTPGFFTLTVMVLLGMSKVILLIRSCSVEVKPKVRAPVHAPTAMLRATATAISMIDATTGLRAFRLLVLILLFPFAWGLVTADAAHSPIVTGILRFNKHSLLSVEL